MRFLKKISSFYTDDDGDGQINEDCAQPPPGEYDCRFKRKLILISVLLDEQYFHIVIS